MTQTTGAISAKDVKLTLASQDISGSSNNFELTPELEKGETYTFDGDWRIVTAGKKRWGGKIGVVYTETTNEGMDELYTAYDGQAAVALTASPQGGSVGEWQFSGNVFITKLSTSWDGTKGDPILVEAEFEGTGALTKAAVAAT